MGKVLVGMTISLDGYIQDVNGSAQSINSDFDDLRETDSFSKMIEDTGAVVMGRNVYEMADPFTWVNEDYEFQNSLFILTHNPPAEYPKGNENLSVTFVTDGIESAISKAKEAAGEKMVQVIGGANVIQQSLNSGMCDLLQIDIMSILLGDGLKLFENIETGKFKLERISVETPTGDRTSMLFNILNTD